MYGVNEHLLITPLDHYSTCYTETIIRFASSMAVKTKTMKVSERAYNLIRRSAFRKRKPMTKVLDEFLRLIVKA